ncbi:hypothetical protein [Gimesia panareensis]|uniref:Uncharacterized protein n=1 Tax=Gimesia panareensis TaxID=2527978 RepID=A0A518A6G6_9PLAN|nr:hypothetical protein [Gimesia panareensis]QDT26767.1 hypothetical protein Enr10x_20770 [Gimesia panareensis]QDU50339.1 hypothetical protein Pan110_26850 [Gimesia panareensis]
MAVFLNIIFLIILFTTGVIVLMLVVAGVLSLLRVRRKWPWLLGAFVIYCSAVGIWQYQLSRPAAVFERQFGFAPPADVRELRSSVWILGDQGHIRLSFKGNRETVQQILKRGLQRREDMGFLERYHRDFSEYFGYEREELIYDKETGHVEFTWEGVD